jgi:flagellar motor switch protein FliN
MGIDAAMVDAKSNLNEPMSNAFSSIPVTVQVMLGTTTMQLSDLMTLKPGCDLMLDQAIGEPVIVIVNGTRIAKGELYVLESRDDMLGVRITEILSQNVV